MKLGSLLAIYLLIWFLTLFAVLPWGVRTSREAGLDLVPGEADSAPVAPNLARKLLWTTLISAILMALFWANYEAGWIVMDDVPGWRPRTTV